MTSARNRECDFAVKKALREQEKEFSEKLAVEMSEQNKGLHRIFPMMADMTTRPPPKPQSSQEMEDSSSDDDDSSSDEDSEDVPQVTAARPKAKPISLSEAMPPPRVAPPPKVAKASPPPAEDDAEQKEEDARSATIEKEDLPVQEEVAPPQLSGGNAVPIGEKKDGEQS